MLRFNLDARPKPKIWSPNREFRFIEEKLDGHRYTILREDRRVRMIGRKTDNDIWPKVGHLFQHSVQHLPLDTILDGELIVRNDHATSVSSAIATADPSLQFLPFAMPFYAGQDMRDSCLRVVRGVLQRQGWQVPRQYVLDEHLITEEYLKTLAIDRNIEGFVLKLEHYAGWWKIKPELTIDAVIMSVKMGTPGSEFDGMIGSLEVGLYGRDGELQSIGIYTCENRFLI